MKKFRLTITTLVTEMKGDKIVMQAGHCLLAIILYYQVGS